VRCLAAGRRLVSVLERRPRRRTLGAVRLLLVAALSSMLVSSIIGDSASASIYRSASIAPAETPKAPKVTKQPLNKTVEEGQSVTFESTASGTPTPTEQWERSTNGGSTWTPIAGASATQLTIASANRSESGNQFRAVFKNGVSPDAISKAATLTVQKAPSVTQQPASTTVEEGQSASFEAAADAFPAATMQWQKSINGGTTWSNIAGATSGKFTIASTKTSENGYEFRATFKNVAGTATSEAATLTVHKAPAITKQPANTTVDEGENATFESTASGFPAPTVQWERSTDAGGTWNAIAGATSTQLTVANVTFSENGNEYRARFTNVAGEAVSAAATLTVHAPPAVTQQPESVIVEAGEGASFEAAANGHPPPTTQWEISTNEGSTWSQVAGATENKLTIASTKAAENGNEYRAVFTNAAGKATTRAALLTVATNHYAAVGWGSNENSQLGDGTHKHLSNVPVSVSGLKFVSAISAGGRHSLALRADGSVLAWGYGGFGQLGNGGNEESDVPVPVNGLTGAKAISAGGNHSLALMKNGTVMAWGENESGQLGDGTNENRNVPVAVKGLTNVVAVSAGSNHTLALLKNGTVMAWGDNENGQLGTGTQAASNVPVAVKGLTGVSSISAGAEFSLALLSNGEVKAWGEDVFGQLGSIELEETFSTQPVLVEGLSGVTAIDAGDYHGLALLGNGTIMAWGEDAYGELGNGTIKNHEAKPVPVSGLAGVAEISAGGKDSAALLSSGSIMAWGINALGTLGDGFTGSPSSVPVAVSGLGKAASVSAGHDHMLAFGEPIPSVTSVSPNIGTTAGGGTITITGVNFTGATAVKFGATSTTFTVVSNESVEAAIPPGAGGTVDVTVATPSGISPTGPADRYTYVAQPTITKISPTSGPVAGGTSVTITGTEFNGVTQVNFGEATAAFTVHSPTSITAIAPEHIAASVDIRVTNIAGVTPVTTKDRFKYTPTVTNVTPNGGPIAGGTSITVTGTGFVVGSGTSFFFGQAKATSVSCSSTTSCTMLTPAHEAGTVDVIAQANKVRSPPNAPADQFTFS
jgi:alpha-tubulin suppressor-like RCC1 family protein